MSKKYIVGKNSVLEAIKFNKNIVALYTTKPINKKYYFPIKIVDKTFLDKITNFQNHQGYVAVISNFEYFDINYLYKKIEQNQISKILILDHIQDPQNLGSILRTANAFNWEHIIIPNKRAATINSTVLKVASGGENNLKIYKVNSLLSVCQNLKKLNFWIYSSSLNKSKGIVLDKVDKLSKKTIIIGNEGKGVSNTLLNIADQEFYIPMSGSVESLNVSIATGIILYMLK